MGSSRVIHLRKVPIMYSSFAKQVVGPQDGRRKMGSSDSLDVCVVHRSWSGYIVGVSASRSFAPEGRLLEQGFPMKEHEEPVNSLASYRILIASPSW